MRLALIQMQVTPGDPAANLARAATHIATAAANNADIALLPEALDCGWTHPSAHDLAQPVPDGTTTRFFQNLARHHNIHIATGLVERAGPLLHNSALLIAPDGEILVHHRKINELDFALDLYSPGPADQPSVAETEHGRIGLMICADGFAENLHVSHHLANLGAKLILSPCAWAVPPDHDNTTTPYGQLWIDSYTPIARQHNLTIAATSNVGAITAGPWENHPCIGNSMVVTPHGPQPHTAAPFGQHAEHILYHTG